MNNHDCFTVNSKSFAHGLRNYLIDDFFDMHEDPNFYDTPSDLNQMIKKLNERNSKSFYVNSLKR